MFSKECGLKSLSAAVAIALVLVPAVALAYDWPQFDLDPQHSGNDPQESIITPGNVANLKRLFQAPLPDVADGAPAYLSGISTPSGTRNLVFVTTRDGHIVALDAYAGTQIWSKQNGPGTCHINNGSTPCYTTSSPAVDPNRQYVYSYGLDGYVHKYDVRDGTEINAGGWPELATLKPQDEKGSAALAVATARNGASYLYVANGGYPGDRGDYQGHLTTINLATGAQHVFNAVCSDRTDVHFVETPGTPDCGEVQTAIWGRAGVVYDPDTDRIYTATGNGTYAPASHAWGDTAFALNPDGTGTSGGPLDSYTPANFQQLDNTDADLGSTIPAILPAPSNSKVQHLAVQGGKDQKLRLLNLDNLSGQGGPGHTGGEVGPVINVPQGGQVLTAPAVWTNPVDNNAWVFIANGNGISGLQLGVDASGTPLLAARWQNPAGGTSPIVAGGVLYYALNGTIQALNPTSGKPLWQDTTIGSIHWESPIVANGVLYITDGNGKLNAYSIGGVPPAPPASTFQFGAPAYTVGEGDGSASINVTRAGDTSGAATVDFATADGTASQRTKYILAASTLSFAPGQTSQSFTVIIIDEAFVEGTQTVNLSLSNPTGMAALGGQSTAVLSITDNDTSQPTTNPLDDARFFVNQHYDDFLARIPDQAGNDYWTGQITQCGTDPQCLHNERVAVSDAFFFEPEYQNTGGFVYRVYKASFGQRPAYAQFAPDRSRIVGGPSLNASKTAFANAFVQRSPFTSQYPSTLTPAQYVDMLNTNTGGSLAGADRDALVSGLQGGTETRGTVLRKIADYQAFIDHEYNASFVLTEYFGYLRRDPDQAGYDFWLGQLNRFPIRDLGAQHAMVCSFITSAEYQKRFSSVVTHSNTECPQ